MGKKLKLGAILCVGAAATAVFVRGIQGIIEDVKVAGVLNDLDDFDDEFEDDEDDFGDSEFDAGSDESVDDVDSSKNFTEADDETPVEDEKAADEAAAQVVSSDAVESNADAEDVK